MSYILDTSFGPVIVFLRSSQYSSVINKNKNNLRFDLSNNIESMDNINI